MMWSPTKCWTKFLRVSISTRRDNPRWDGPEPEGRPWEWPPLRGRWSSWARAWSRWWRRRANFRRRQTGWRWCWRRRRNFRLVVVLVERVGEEILFLMEEQKQRKEMKKHRRAKKRCVLFSFVFSSKKFRNSNRNKMATGCKSGEEKSGFNLKDTDFESNV